VSTAPTASLGRRLVLPAVVFVVALVPRASFLAELRSSSPTYERPEGGDSIFFDRVASGDPAPRRAYFHSPLYRWFLSGIYAVAGRQLTVVRAVQHLLGAGTAVLVFLLALRLFRRRGLALLAGLLFALQGPPLFYEGQLLVDAILPFCVVLAGYAAVRHFQRPVAPLPALALGLAIGLGALGRPTLLLWVPIVLLWSLFRAAPRRLLPPALVCLGLVLVILPVTVRNFVVERDLVLITSNGGLNLYIGNNPNARGTYNLPAGLWFRPGDPTDDFMGVGAVRSALGREPRSSEISSWWARRALAHIWLEPWRSLGVMARKAAALISNNEHPQLYNYYVYAEICSTLALLPTAGWLIAPALLGIVGCLWLCRGERRLYALLVAAYGACFLCFFVEGRYRAAWLALLAPLAAWGVFALVDALRERQRDKILAFAGGAAVAVLACFALPTDRASPGPQYQFFGQARMQQGQLARALVWYLKAVEAAPDDPRAHEGLGIALGRTGQHREAHEALTRAAELWPSSGHIQNNLGLVCRRLGRDREAEAAFRRAIRLAPDLAEAYANLGSLLEQRGQREGAAELYRSALLLAPRRTPWAAAVRRMLEGNKGIKNER
jgi:tetratricopeptide (TPR) repeat protein